MLGSRLSVHSTWTDTPELPRWRARRFTVFLVLAGADLLAAGLSWIVPMAGYLAVAGVIGQVLTASHPVDVERRTLGAGEDGEG